SAGTTLTGAVDPIAELADVCAARGVWLHIDGAYGLPAAAAPSAAAHFRGLDRADSVTIDAHKWLYLPKACSVVLVRRQDHLHTADAHNAEIVRRLQEGGEYWVAPALIDGRTYIRPCIVNFRTCDEDVTAFVDLVERTGRALL